MSTTRYCLEHKTDEDLLANIEYLVASIAAKPDAKQMLRRLPAGNLAAQPTLNLPGKLPAKSSRDECELQQRIPEPPAEPAAKALPSTLAPLSSTRYRLQITLSSEGHAKLLRARELLAHQVPNGDLASVCERALDVLVEQLEARKFAKRRRRKKYDAAVADSANEEPVEQKSPAPAQASDGQQETPAKEGQKGRDDRNKRTGHRSRKRSRYIRTAVRRAVAQRDGYCCTFVGPDNQRCGERSRLEFHHLKPFGKGGGSTVDNLTLRCRCHNEYQAELDYGAAAMRRKTRGTKARESGVFYGVAAPVASFPLGRRVGRGHPAAS